MGSRGCPGPAVAETSDPTEGPAHQLLCRCSTVRGLRLEPPAGSALLRAACGAAAVRRRRQEKRRHVVSRSRHPIAPTGRAGLVAFLAAERHAEDMALCVVLEAICHSLGWDRRTPRGTALPRDE